MATADNLAHARDAFRRRGRTDAYRLLGAADRDEPLESDDLERLATAAYLIGKDAESTEFWARAHQEFQGARRRGPRGAMCVLAGRRPGASRRTRAG